ncbi:MAG: FMN-binding protein, partial [Succinivibrionaceae bacterium]|nr:FMN-binding protein [Succinivibrionaceae bacterium]
SFRGKSLQNATFKVKKDGGDFDSFTGATITPRAITEAVGGLLELEKDLAAPEGLSKLQTPCGGKK